MKWYTRWKHRRMIRKTWSFWYMEQGSIARGMWLLRREQSVGLATSMEAMNRYFLEYKERVS